MSKDYKTINYAVILLLLIVGMVFIPSALIATIPASIALFLGGKIFKRYEMRYHDAFIAAFWAAFCYLTVSMLMAFVLYLRAVHIQHYEMSFYPSWLVNYYTPRHFPNFYTIMTVLHVVCILAAAFIFSRKLKSRLNQPIPYGYAVLWTMFILLPCLLFGIYTFLYVVHHLFPEQLQAGIDFMLIK